MYTVTDRLSSNLLLTLGLLFSATAFSTMYLSTTAWHIIPVQLLIAASWSCLYVGALREVTEGDVRKSTTTGLLNSIIYLGNIVCPLIGGFISEFIGNYKGNMLLAACMIFPTVPFYVFLSRNKSNT